MLESVVFALIGLQLPALVRNLPAGERGFVWVALAVTGVLLVTRAAFLYPVARLPGLIQRRRDEAKLWRSGFASLQLA